MRCRRYHRWRVVREVVGALAPVFLCGVLLGALLIYAATCANSDSTLTQSAVRGEVVGR